MRQDASDELQRDIQALESMTQKLGESERMTVVPLATALKLARTGLWALQGHIDDHVAINILQKAIASLEEKAKGET